MVNTNMHVFRHPKFYEEYRKRAKRYQKELRERNKSDQAISLRAHDGECERAPDPGQKQQASSAKHQASSTKLLKHQATSVKPQATSVKLKATSVKLLDHGPWKKFHGA